MKQSGVGREGSRHGLEDYLEVKYLWMGGLTSLASMVGQCYARDTISVTGSAFCAWSRISKVYRPSGSTPTE